MQGIAGEIGLGPAIKLASVSRDRDYPRSTFAITFFSLQLGDPGFGFPRDFHGWQLDVRGGGGAGD